MCGWVDPLPGVWRVVWGPRQKSPLRSLVLADLPGGWQSNCLERPVQGRALMVLLEPVQTSWRGSRSLAGAFQYCCGRFRLLGRWLHTGDLPRALDKQNKVQSKHSLIPSKHPKPPKHPDCGHAVWGPNMNNYKINIMNACAHACMRVCKNE